MPNRKKNLPILVAASIIFLFSPKDNLLAQSQYTAIIPGMDIAVPANAAPGNFLQVGANAGGTEIARSLLLFNLNALPQSAKISKLTLMLYVSSRTDTALTATQTVTLLKGNSDWATKIPSALIDPVIGWTDIKNNKTPIGIDEVKKKTAQLNFKLRIPAQPLYVTDFLPDGLLSIAARSPKRSENNFFYSSATAVSTKHYSNKPKLIVKYEVNFYPKRNDWAQTFNTPQRSGYLNWATNSNIITAAYQVLPNANKELYAGADPTGAMLIFKNKPLVFTQAASGTGTVYFVKQLDGNGAVLWSQGVDNLAKCCPVIDEMGRLYYFSVSGTLSILDLNNSGAFVTAGGITYQKQKLTDITKSQANAITNGVTLGYDGTLYLSTNAGLLALSAYPQLAVRWRYDNAGNEKTGPVSLSADESKAFFISVDTIQNNSRLLVLNNMDGTKLDSSVSVGFSYFAEQLGYLIPAPVVQGNSKIFVLSGFDNGRVLYRFGINTTTNKLDSVAQVNAPATTNTGISQPVTGQLSNVYFVFNNKIARFDSTKKNNVDFLDSSNSLDNASILVTDKSSNIYALDPVKHNVLCFNYKVSGGLNYVFSVGVDTTKKNVVLATDGTIYTMNLNNIKAVRPVSVNQDTITFSQPADLNTSTLYRANNTITLKNFIVQNSINAVFYSGGSISFKPGFAVSQGAQLLFKTGFLKQ